MDVSADSVWECGNIACMPALLKVTASTALCGYQARRTAVLGVGGDESLAIRNFIPRIMLAPLRGVSLPGMIALIVCSANGCHH